jgi:transglutaminase-like putative cysteine protease
MRRREFLMLSAAVPVAALPVVSVALPASEAPPQPGWRTFELITSVEVASPLARTRLWLPVPVSASSNYQRLISTEYDAPGAVRAQLLMVAGSDVQLLYVEWADPAAVGRVTLTHHVATCNRRVYLGAARRASSTTAASVSSGTLQRYLRATALLPTDGIVRTTAEGICAGKHRDIDKARAIYEWVVENTNRDPKTPGCGMGDVGSMLKSGYLGGKCADINALFVALARAVQIPARDVYGIRVADSRLGYQSLGRSGDVSKAQHCRGEFYAQEMGWIPVDPADVRKVMLEEVPGGLSLADPKVQAARSALFGSWEMNWLAYNYGHDVVLPGSSKPPVPFLMYPNAETGGERINSLDPTTFRYQIHARELTS